MSVQKARKFLPLEFLLKQRWGGSDPAGALQWGALSQLVAPPRLGSLFNVDHVVEVTDYLITLVTTIVGLCISVGSLLPASGDTAQMCTDGCSACKCEFAFSGPHPSGRPRALSPRGRDPAVSEGKRDMFVTVPCAV